MKFNIHFTTPPHWLVACFLALSILFTFPSCSDGSSGGSDDEQVTTPKNYTITFNLNGGTGSIENITEVAGTEITLPAGAEFSEDGFDYTFAGWNTKPNATGKNYVADEKITLNSNFTLYAKWGLTAENALKKIKGITESGVHTVSIVGNVADCIAKTDRNTLSQMHESLWALQQSYPDARIILDLSGTDDLTAIPDYAFKGNSSFYCKNLSGIILPQSVKSIGLSAFSMCENLVDVVMPKTLDFIGNYAFDACNSLTEIVIPESVKELGIIFENCTSLKDVSLPSSLRKLTGTFWDCSSLEKIVIPEGVEILGHSVFYGCSSLIDATLPSTLKEFEINGSYIEYGSMVFKSCESLKNIVIPDGVTELKEGLFYECSSLESITIPASVTEIGMAAFYSCKKLSTVNYKGTKSDWETKVKPNISSAQAYGENANIALSRATIICTDGRIEPTDE